MLKFHRDAQIMPRQGECECFSHHLYGWAERIPVVLHVFKILGYT